MLSLVHFQYHSSRYRGNKLDTDCSKLLLILQKQLEETFLRGTRTLTLGQMSVSLKPRLTASALSGKISPWFDPVCGTKLEAMLAPETALQINEFLTGRYSAVLSFKFSLSSQTESWGCRFSCCVYYSSRWALIAALCMTYSFEWVHQPIFFYHLFNVMHAFDSCKIHIPTCSLLFLSTVSATAFMYVHKIHPSPPPTPPKASSSDKYLLLGLQIYLPVLQLWQKTLYVEWFLVQCFRAEQHSLSSD